MDKTGFGLCDIKTIGKGVNLYGVGILISCSNQAGWLFPVLHFLKRM
jgi:hypothetical protein